MHVLILLAVVGAALAVPRSTQRIVGGEPTTIEDYPYMSNMMYGRYTFAQQCGGALLNERMVLSAAHCYYRTAAIHWRVRLGTTRTTSGGEIHSVSSMRIHPRYSDRTLNNDIAIVRLASSAVLNNITIAAARLPSSQYFIHDDSDVTAIGWGVTKESGTDPTQLRHVHVKIVNHKVCTERYAYLKTLPAYSHYPNINEGMLCAGALDVGGKDACQGDSGGPLAQGGNIVVGITSWGHECGHHLYPGVNARVPYFFDWIMENTKLL